MDRHIRRRLLRGFGLRHRLRRGLCLTSPGLMVLWTSPGWAMKQCPEEFGPQAPWVNVAGWSTLVLGLALGGLFAGSIIRRTRPLPVKTRVLAALGALIGMSMIWVGGLSLSMAFFLAC